MNASAMVAILALEASELELEQLESALSVLPFRKQLDLYNNQLVLFNNLLALHQWATNKQWELCNKFQWVQLSEALAAVSLSSVGVASLV